MSKLIVVAVVGLATIAYFNDPSSLKPWGEVGASVGKVVAKAVKETGNTTNKALQEEERTGAVADKVKDVANGVSSAVASAGTVVKDKVAEK